MSSRLRPTPETGAVPSTRMDARPIGPSMDERVGRASRLGYRHALRNRQYGDAVEFARAGAAAPSAGLRRAEDAMSEDFQGRQYAGALMSEIGQDIGSRLGARTDLTQGGPDIGVHQQPKIVSDSTIPKPGAPTAPPVPPSPNLNVSPVPPAAQGASPPPENPVSGNKVPVTGDVRSRLADRGSWRGQFMNEVEQRVRGGAAREDAIDALNKERIAAGKAPFDKRAAVDMLHTRSASNYGRAAGPQPAPFTADLPPGGVVPTKGPLAPTAPKLELPGVTQVMPSAPGPIAPPKTVADRLAGRIRDTRATVEDLPAKVWRGGRAMHRAVDSAQKSSLDMAIRGGRAMSSAADKARKAALEASVYGGREMGKVTDALYNR